MRKEVAIQVDDRITRGQMFMQMAQVVSYRGTCSRASVGAVIARNNRVISMGYVGSPAGLPHCTETGCEIGPEGGCITTVHAEANAICFAAKEGISVNGATLYVTLSPCLNCAKLIINSGITRLVYLEKYRDDSGIILLVKAGVTVDSY